MVLIHGVQTPDLKSVLEQTAQIPVLDFLCVMISQDTPCTLGRVIMPMCVCTAPKAFCTLKTILSKKDERISFVIHFTSMLNPVCQQQH